MAIRDDIRVAWLDVARGEVEIPRNRPVRLILERAEIGYLEFPVEDPFFSPSGAMVLPEGAAPALAKLFQLASDQPGRLALALGHCQSASSQAKVMSQHRADGIVALLGGPPWARHCHKHHTVADLQQSLAWVAATRAVKCDPGTVGGVMNAQTMAALEAFRSAVEAEVGAPPGVGPTPHELDWDALRLMVDDEAARLAGMTETELAEVRDAFKFVAPASIGCGHTWSLDPIALHNYEPQSVVRVDLFFFPEALPPLIAKETSPGESIYRERNYSCQPVVFAPSEKTVVGTGQPPETGGGISEGEGMRAAPPPLESTEAVVGVVVLDSVGSTLTPGGPAPLALRLSVRGSVDIARIEVHSVSFGGGALFARPLSGSERQDDTTTTIQWDGRTNTRFGASLGPAVTSAFSPYQLSVVYDGGGGIQERTTAFPIEVP